MNSIELLQRIRERLALAHGPRLIAVILYGSEARGEARADSDIDVLVLLSGPISYWRDLGTSVDALYSLVLELERPIHPKPVAVEDYEAGEFPLYRRARAEGVRA